MKMVFISPRSMSSFKWVQRPASILLNLIAGYPALILTGILSVEICKCLLSFMVYILNNNKRREEPPAMKNGLVTFGRRVKIFKMLFTFCYRSSHWVWAVMLYNGTYF